MATICQSYHCKNDVTWTQTKLTSWRHIDANALELLQYCTKPSYIKLRFTVPFGGRNPLGDQWILLTRGQWCGKHGVITNTSVTVDPTRHAFIYIDLYPDKYLTSVCPEAKAIITAIKSHMICFERYVTCIYVKTRLLCTDTRRLGLVFY